MLKSKVVKPENPGGAGDAVGGGGEGLGGIEAAGGIGSGGGGLGLGGGMRGFEHVPHETGQAPWIAAAYEAWLQYGTSWVHDAGLPPMVKPVVELSAQPGMIGGGAGDGGGRGLGGGMPAGVLVPQMVKPP